MRSSFFSPPLSRFGVPTTQCAFPGAADGRLPASTQYTAALVVLSIAISMLFPVLGLRPLGIPNGGSARSPVWLGTLIATGIVGMHYTAMGAVHFMQQPSLESGRPGRLLVASPQLAIMVFEP